MERIEGLDHDQMMAHARMACKGSKRNLAMLDVIDNAWHEWRRLPEQHLPHLIVLQVDGLERAGFNTNDDDDEAADIPIQLPPNAHLVRKSLRELQERGVDIDLG